MQNPFDPTVKTNLKNTTQSPTEPSGELINAFGGRYYRISHSDRLPSFFMSMVSSSNLWLFLASNGGLTAGRGDAEGALFTYQTVDRIYDSVGINGPLTALWVEVSGQPVLWEPLNARATTNPAIVRNLYKSIEGDRVWFEEINNDLGLAFRYGWSTSESHGFVRRCELENLGTKPCRVRLLDGLRNLLPAGIPLRLQSMSSCLADAYKTAERHPKSTLATYALAAGIVDRAIPLESLRASIACSEGLPDATILLSDRQLGKFYAGGMPASEANCRGIRGSYFLTTSLTITPKATQNWLMIADVGLTQSEVTQRNQELVTGSLSQNALLAIEASTDRLRQLVGAADGLQTGGEEITNVHHFANVLFNIMRGGIYVDGHTVPGRDFAVFVKTRNRLVADRQAALLTALPDSIAHPEFVSRLAATADRDLERLGFEYLPLTFSRRHGDPSRPWNRFSIRIRDDQGNRLLSHEGNWRDIFQNWEALGQSHPEFFESIVSKFVNASTLDGYNPYRISNTGIDWEVPDHEDPWASIGYWGDHQVIYLQKLLEWSGRFHPGRLESWLRREQFTYGNVPYRIAEYPAMQRDPHATIEFDAAKDRTITQLAAQMGTDARLVQSSTGGVQHVNLTEKLLLLVLTRLTNFVPGGGIWMNTQRPEWNDANNALVGYGVSMVTLSYLRRLIVHLHDQLIPSLGPTPVAVASPLVNLLRALQTAYDGHRSILTDLAIEPVARRSLLDAVAIAGSKYRSVIYKDSLGTPSTIDGNEIQQLLKISLAFIDHTIRNNRRPDGLYHSYNLLEFTENPPALHIHRLSPMLEGQVAVLSAGLLSADEVIELITALRRSPLYRQDQHSYLLYPDRELPGFLTRNIIAPDEIARSPFLGALLAHQDTRLVVKDADGHFRFAADLANGDMLASRLKEMEADPRWRDQLSSQISSIKVIYENTFHHHAFTGRSGSMFGYEGLGCIYWHMVAKLLLAVQENLFAAEANASPLANRLREHYFDIRSGLGFNKTPVVYGAFPTDPYSHTPGHSGAQQPGMTGQVKEEILTRFGELGIKISAGTIGFRPTLLKASEFNPEPSQFTCFNTNGETIDLSLPNNSLAFTLCGTPVSYQLSPGAPTIRVHFQGKPCVELKGHMLPKEISERIFARDGGVTQLEVILGSDYHPYAPAKKA